MQTKSEFNNGNIIFVFYSANDNFISMKITDKKFLLRFNKGNWELTPSLPICSGDIVKTI